ncbi:hypothetical protein AB6A40_001056 [Gnathostoma spinigerum]|uniref:Atos-like conserved domain-containing protein n=1 Tax=Gnathostoma spinigerum TaxID=75299 RepID=A0ABD6ECX1_9BILA
MELGSELVRMVMESRGGTITAMALAESEHIISMGVPLSVHTLVAHENCLQNGGQCENAVLIEIWTVKLNRHCLHEEKPLEPVFLKNAVRSHLYFSQLNSWITNNGGRLPSKTVCTYRLSVNEVSHSDNAFIESHTFPTARCSPTSSITVTVTWKKRASAPQLIPCASISSDHPNRFSKEDWILPTESLSRSVSSTSLSSVTSTSPHFFLSLDDESGHHHIENLSPAGDSTRSHGVTPSSSPEFNSYTQHISFSSRVQRHSRGKTSRRHDSVSPSSPPRKKYSHERNESITSTNDDHHLVDSPTDPLIDGLLVSPNESDVVPNEHLIGHQKVVIESTEVENLAEFLATSSTISPLVSSTGNPTINAPVSPSTVQISRRETRPRRSFIASALRYMSSAPVSFNKITGLPLNSSPAPLTRNERSFTKKRFASVTSGDDDSSASDNEGLFMARSAPTTNGLLCNFEESALNGRLEPLAALDGFQLQLTASGHRRCLPHITLPVTTFFFNISEDDAPSPYLGHCSLDSLGRKGYRIPKRGTIQATLFNPQGTIVRIFVVRFDVTQMPPSSRTFIRQRTFFMRPDCSLNDAKRSWLRYLIHIR